MSFQITDSLKSQIIALIVINSLKTQNEALKAQVADLSVKLAEAEAKTSYIAAQFLATLLTAGALLMERPTDLSSLIQGIGAQITAPNCAAIANEALKTGQQLRQEHQNSKENMILRSRTIPKKLNAKKRKHPSD
jgi:hypothetical protein